MPVALAPTFDLYLKKYLSSNSISKNLGYNIFNGITRFLVFTIDYIILTVYIVIYCSRLENWDQLYLATTTLPNPNPNLGLLSPSTIDARIVIDAVHIKLT